MLPISLVREEGLEGAARHAAATPNLQVNCGQVLAIIGNDEAFGKSVGLGRQYLPGNSDTFRAQRVSMRRVRRNNPLSRTAQSWRV